MASANNALVGAVRAEATLEGGKFVSGAKKIQQSAKQTETQLKKSFGVMGSAVKGFGVSLASGLSIGLLSSAIKKALDYAGSLGEVAQQLGVTTRDLQTFRFAAGQVGVSQEQLETGLKKLTITMGQLAAGAKAPRAALEGVRKGLADQIMTAKDGGDAFRILADALKPVTSRAARAAVEIAVMGKSGANLDNLLSGGSDALNALAEAADRLGIVLSDEQIQKADDTADKLDALQTVLSARIAGVVADNAEAVVQLADSFAQLVADIGAAASALARFANSAPSWVKQIAGAAANVINPVGTIAGAIKDQLSKGGSSVTTNLPSVARTSVDGRSITPFLARSGGRSKRATKAPKDTSLRDAFQFEEEQRRAEMDILRAKQELASDYVERTALSIQMLNLEKESFEAELKFRIASKELSGPQAEALKLKFEETDRLKRMAVLEEEELNRQRDYNMLEEKDFDIKMDKLAREARLAETASERRYVELRILDLAYEEERRRLNRIIQESKDWAQIEAARRYLLALSENQSLDRAGVIQATRGPMEDWLAQLPTTAAKAQEAFEQLQVQGFEGLIDAAVALTDGFDSAKDALLSTLKQFLQGLLRMQLQQGLGSLLGSGGGGLGSVFGSIFGGGASGGMSAGSSSFLSSSLPGAMSAPSGFKLTGFAHGGSMMLRGVPGIDKNIISMNGIPIARANYGERLNFEPANDTQTGGRVINQNFNVYANDADSFRRSERQIARDARRRLA